jgi:hypothetical protein
VPDARRDRFDDGLGQNVRSWSSVSLRGDPHGFCLHGPEQRKFDPLGQGLGGKLGWLVTCGDRLDTQAGLVRSGPEPTAVSLGGSAFFALSIPIALRRQPYLAQHARGCAECQYQASVRSDSLAERSEFELPVPVSKLSDDSVVL